MHKDPIEIMFATAKKKALRPTSPTFYLLLFLVSISAILGGLGLYKPTKDAMEDEADGLKYLAILCNIIINTFVTFKVSKDNVNHFVENYCESIEEEEFKDQEPHEESNLLNYSKSLLSIPVSIGSGVVISYISAWSPFLPFWTMFSFQLLNQFNINYYSARPRVSNFLNFLALNRKQKQLNSQFNTVLAYVDQVNEEIDNFLTYDCKDSKVSQLIQAWEAEQWHEFKDIYGTFFHKKLFKNNIFREIFFYVFQLINQYSLIIYYNSTFDFFKSLGSWHDNVSWLLTSFCLILFHIVTWDFSSDTLMRVENMLNSIIKDRRVSFRYSLNNSTTGKLMLFSLISSALLGFFYSKNLLDFAAFGYEGTEPHMQFLQKPFPYYFTLLTVTMDSIVYNLMGAVEPCADFSKYSLLLKGNTKMQLLETLKNIRLACERYPSVKGTGIARSILGITDDSVASSLLHSPIATFRTPSICLDPLIKKEEKQNEHNSEYQHHG